MFLELKLKENLIASVLIDVKNIFYQMSHIIRKPAFCIICQKKGADQLYGNHAADQHLCFCYIDNTIPILPNSEI